MSDFQQYYHPVFAGDTIDASSRLTYYMHYMTHITYQVEAKPLYNDTFESEINKILSSPMTTAEDLLFVDQQNQKKLSQWAGRKITAAGIQAQYDAAVYTKQALMYSIDQMMTKVRNELK